MSGLLCYCCLAFKLYRLDDQDIMIIYIYIFREKNQRCNQPCVRACQLVPEIPGHFFLWDVKGVRFAACMLMIELELSNCICQSLYI